DIRKYVTVISWTVSEGLSLTQITSTSLNEFLQDLIWAVFLPGTSNLTTSVKDDEEPSAFPLHGATTSPTHLMFAHLLSSLPQWPAPKCNGSTESHT
ncbi:hypothetical protein AVEN_219116-1, partial [Araneus ventricosus]